LNRFFFMVDLSVPPLYTQLQHKQANTMVYMGQGE
jgi:hypothetical protein